MFEIGFQEIILIGIVALLVLGPEKMPAAVRTLALMIGRLKRSFTALKTEIEKEIGADEIRRQLRNEDIMAKFKQTQAQVQNSISSVKQDVETFQKNIELESQAAAMSSQGSVASNTTSTPATTSAPVPAIAETTLTAADPASPPATDTSAVS